MTKATDIQAIDSLLSVPAANADKLEHHQLQGETPGGGTTVNAPGAWDSFEVWRRLIKEPRDRRRPQPN